LDNDGWPDLAAGGRVWHNKLGKGFRPFSSQPVGSVVAADFDNDGFVDLFSWSQLQLFRNEAGREFTPTKLPFLPKVVSRGACWGDFNNDGFVDLYVGGYEDWNANVTYPSLVLTNQAGREFGLAYVDRRYRARGVTACDFNRDGWLDVYVSNYRLMPNLLFVGNRHGRWLDRAELFNAVATSPGFRGGHSIGACWGDFDNDGEFDLFAGNFAHVDRRGDQPKSRFHRNRGPSGSFHFEDRGTGGVYYQESYASPVAGDFDNDGRLDLFLTTVYATASFQRENFPVLFHNEGDLAFTDVTAAAGLARLGPTYQAAAADFDRDGDLDLVASGRLFANTGSTNKWLAVRLRGDGLRVNRSAIGAQARLHREGSLWARQVEAGTGEGNQNDLTLHFGLGGDSRTVRVEIVWPDGRRQTIRTVRPNHLLVLE
jgi:hypothetical protein